MEIDADRFYRAVQSRDARFDGRFFTAVVTTGVYCRPVCPARTPLRRNVCFYASAAAAEEAGFRPCLRCRPETAPGTPAWGGTSSTVSRALRLIDSGALDDGDVTRLAERLGVGARHLRRLFDEHLGAPPIAVAQVRRVHFARRLIDETDLPMTEIAFASGFASLRRFQHAVRSTFGRSPRDLRRMRVRAENGGAGSAIALRLSYRPPYDWASILSFLAERAIPGVESVDGGTYGRTVAWGERAGTIRVRRSSKGRHLVLETDLPASRDLIGVVERVRGIFDLAADPAPIAACLRRDPLLRSRVRAHPGLRVPGAWDRFELAVRAVLGQQITVKGASTLAGRIVRRCGATVGASIGGGARLTHLFPSPRDLAGADLSGLGITGARIRTIRMLAIESADGALFDEARGAEETIRRLAAIPGIGAWTASYIAMRAFSEPDILPPGDAGIRRALAGMNGRGRDHAIAGRAEAWRPWRSYATLHLWTA